tara:strand:+ start:126 stop:491 length:366 start_codon:yes stop_codon:yes gene_type:complete
MSDEKYSIKTEFPVTFSSAVSNLDRSITFHVGGKKRLKIDKDGFYVDERLVANDTEIYEAFKDFLNSCSGKETQDEPEDKLHVLALAMVDKKDKETGPAWSEASEEIAKIMVAFHRSLIKF